MRRQPSPPARRPAPWLRRPTLGFEPLEDRTQPATLSLTLDNPALVENGLSTTVTLTRTGDLSQALSVAVANSDTTEASAPTSVTIPAGKATATFTVSPVDDTVFDGTQPVTLTATAVTGPLTVGYDTTFAGDGVVDTPAITGGSSTNPGAVLALPDGKVVAAASNPGFNGWSVYLMNPDGSVVVTSYVPLPGATDAGTVFALARQADGKILVAGDSTVNGVTDWAVARLNPDLTVDFTFGTNGAVTFPVIGYESIYDLKVEADGNILVAGFVQQAGGFSVRRLSPTGATIGQATVPVYAGSDTVYPSANDMAIAPDGKIVLAGTVRYTNASVVLRLNPDLSPDTSFGPGGYRTLSPADFGTYTEIELNGVAVLADGRVVAGGTAFRSANQIGGEFAAVRFNPDGTLDTSFAGDGTTTLSLAGGGADDARALDLAVQADGKVVLGGYAWRIGNGENQALARLTTAGTPDTNFNGTGFFVTADYPAQGSFEQINAIDLLPDGRLVAQAGGTTPVTNGNTTTMVSKQWVARFVMATGETLTATANLTVADDDPGLALSVSPATFAETAGANAATATVTRINGSLAAALTVTLTSSDTTEATVPATVTIPAGQASVTFPVAAVDDTIPDGTQNVTITATAAGLTATAGVSVTDNEPPGPALQVTIDKTGVLEQTGASAATGTVTRYGFPLDQALTVTLSSSDTTEATVPSSVVIPAGAASATFAVAAVDDTFTDGTIAVTITASAPTTALTGPITYDTTWGPYGGYQSSWVNAQVAVAPDGKLVVAGTYGTVGTNADFGVFRYNANGTPDTTFGSSGRVQVNVIGPSDQPAAVLVQPDGKVVIAGYGAVSSGAAGEVVLVRLLTSGGLDSTFGSNGIVRLTAFGGVAGSVSDAALQADGKILLSGNIGGKFAVMRLTAAGALDTTFNGTGWVTTDLGSATGNRAYAVAVAPDGRVVAAGVTGQGSTATARTVVVRYNADGTPDATFGPGGVRETDVAGATYSEQATDVAVQADGKVVVADTLGNSSNGSSDFAVLRFNTDGTLDSGFATSGIYTEAAASAYGGATRVVVQADGRILAAGTAGTYQAGTIRGRFVRLSPAGVLENRADSAWTTSTTQSIAQDASGNIYLAYNYGSGGSSGYVDRYRTVGAPVTATTGLSVLDNEPFAAVADSYSATEETTLTVTAANGVRSNDVVTAPLSGTSVTAELVAGPANGTLTFNADGSFTYTPNPNFFGTDAFTYRLRDGGAVTSAATVAINVANVNDAPVAANDSYTTAEDTPLTVGAAAGTTFLTMTSDPGDYIGQGQTYSYTTPAWFSVSGNASYLTVSYHDPNYTHWWYLDFRAPFDNTPLAPGTYLNAERAAFRTVGKPGLDVSGDGRGSNGLTGKFTILQIETGANGQITRFAADFEQHSEGATPALRGSVRFNYVPGAGPGVLANDSDPDRDPLTVSLVAGPAHGQVTLNPDGTFTYTPAADYNGPDSFQYRASDGQLSSNTATVSLTVTAVNDPPVTRDDAATTAEDTAATINVLANDSDVEGAPLKPTVVTQPAHGTVTVNAANQIVYTPAANFNGTDTFTYKATENLPGGPALSGNVATVTVTVTPVNDAPVAQPNSYTTDQDVTLAAAAPGVLGNDTDVDGDPLAAVIATAPTHGTVTLNADGSFTYVPAAGYFGTDSFTYSASDGTLPSAAATVTLTVLRTNFPPVAQDDSATTNEDTQVGIAVIANDSDPDGDPIQAVVYTQPAHGTAAYSPNDGKVYYTPAANFNGTDTFTYRAYDGRAYSAPATVTVTVIPVPDAPVAKADSFGVYEDTTLSVPAAGVLGNDTDADGDPLIAALVTGPAHGTLAFNADGSFTYTPNANYNGTDTFTYTASDGTLYSNTATVTITVYAVNDPPVGNPDTLNATEDKALSILVTDLTGNDTDVDGDTLSIGTFTQPAHGTLTRGTTFSGLIYTPAANYNGPDSFTYQPLDRAQALGNVTTVTMTVAAVNDPPVARADAYTLAEDTTLTVAAPGVLANDTDPENDPLSAVLVTGPANGTLTFNADGSFTYTPRANYSGTDSFTYRASDGQLQGANGATVFLTVTAVNDAPTAAPDSYAVAEDGTLAVAAAGTALDQQSTTVTGGGQVFNAGASGTHWQQGLKAGFAGTLKLIDLKVYSGSGSFDLYVNKGAPWQSDAPEYVTRVTVPAGSSNTWITVDVSAGNVQLAAGEDFTFGVRNGSGPDLFLLGTQDTGTGYAGGRLYSNGIAYPAGASYSYDLLFRTRMTAPGGVLANDTDPDGNALSAVLVSGPGHGTLSLAADGGFTYTPAPDYFGPDSFTYKANDGALDSNVVTVSLTVTAVNDPPVARPDAATTDEDAGPVAVAVLANDTDVEGDPLSVTAVTQGANGSVTFTASGATYTPNPNFFGTDTFTYTVSDGNGGTATGTVTVIVNPVNDAPTLDPVGAVTIDEDAGAQAVTLTGITAGPGESQALTVTASSDNPALILNPTVSYTSPAATGSLSFAPAADASGTATITVTVSDGQLTAVRQFTVTVNPVNDPPTLDPVGNLTINEDAGAQTVALSGITAGGGESQTLTVTASSSNPTLIPTPTVNYASPNAAGTLSFTPAANGNGSAVVTVTVSDGLTTTSRQFTVAVTPVNDPPAAGNDSAATAEDTPVAVAVLANDTDVDGDPLSVTAVTQGAHGSVAFTAAGVTYTPAANYNGTDSFTYTVSDGNGGTATATVAMTVTPVNDAPVAGNDTATTAEDTAVAVAVLGNDSDVDGDALAVTAVTQGANGAVTFTATGVTYTPAANFFGSDSFTYTVSDGHGGNSTATVAVTVTAVNDPPTLDALANRTIAEDAGTQTVSLSGITAGPNESQTLTVTATSSNPALIPTPVVSYASPNTAGTLTFVPAADASGTATITVTVSDGQLTAVRQFTVTVTAVNDPPTLAALGNLTINEDAGTQTVALSGITAGGGESQPLTVTATSSNPALIPNPTVSYTSPNAGGTLSFTPAANGNGSAVITVTVSDGQTTATQTFTVTVTPVNDAPSFAAGANQSVVAGSGPQSVGGWAKNVSRGPADEAGQGLAFVVTANSNPGLFVAPPTIDPATGALTFIPEASATGTATVTVVLKDTGGTANGGADTSAALTFTITLTPNGLPTTPGIRMVGSELVITGADTNDTVTVTQQGASGAKVTATLNGKKYNNQSFGGVTRIRVDAKGGNDTIDLSGVTSLPTWVDAGAGDDTVTGGGGADQICLGAGDDTADGGAGDDLIAGGAGQDLIQGGAGNDALYGGDDDDFVIGGPGVDQLFGQAGNDILVGGSAAVRIPSTDSLRKVLTDWNPAATGTGGYANIRSRLTVTDDAGADQLTGGAGTDWFWEPVSVALVDQESGEQRN